MGIFKLMSLIQQKAPGAIRQMPVESYANKKVSCDASLTMYQFLSSTQFYSSEKGITQLTDKDGNQTGHLGGLLFRTIQFVECGIRPVWVFDGTPPTLKSQELAKRRKIRETAKNKFEELQEAGDLEEAFKHKLRATHITSTNKEDAIKLINLIGVPLVQASSEAEAECSWMNRQGITDATVTEDLDALCFQSPVLLRGFKSKKESLTEISTTEVLKGLELTYEEFVDLCILCGCDYTARVEGIGFVTAYKLIREHKKIEKVLEYIEKVNKDPQKKKKHAVPENFEFEKARELLMKPAVSNGLKAEDIKWRPPDEEGLVEFLAKGKGFGEPRIRKSILRLKKAIKAMGQY